MSDINDFVIEYGVLKKYNGSEQIVKIPDSVSSIGDFAFSGCTGLTSVKIPNSVTSIGKGVFWDCKGLTSIEIASSVSSIGRDAFRGCTGLKTLSISQDNEFFASVNGAIYSKDRKKLIKYVCLSNATHFSIPDGVTTIATWAFDGCIGLTSIEIPDSVTYIGEEAFLGCEGLTSIEIPNSVSSIGGHTFSFCNDNLVIITSAGSYAEEYAKKNGIKVKLV